MTCYHFWNTAVAYEVRSQLNTRGLNNHWRTNIYTARIIVYAVLWTFFPPVPNHTFFDWLEFLLIYVSTAPYIHKAEWICAICQNPQHMTHVRPKVYLQIRNKCLYSGCSPSTFVIISPAFISFGFCPLCPSYCKLPQYREYIISLPIKLQST